MFKNILSHFYILIYISMQIVLIKTQDCFDSRSRPGNCIPLARCPDIYEEFHEQTRMATYPIDFQTFISSSICGFDGVNQMICCRSRSFDKVMMPNSQMHSQDLSRISTNPQRETTVIFAPLDDKPQTPVNNPKKPIKPISRPTKTNKDTLIFLPIKPVQEIPSPPQEEHHQPVISATGNCGTNQIFISRIVGGSAAKRGNYPWMAALGYRNQNNPNVLEYECGGSLITSKHVLTCAHCIRDQLYAVRLGAYDLSNKAEPNARNYRIKRVIIHEQYEMKIILNNKRWVTNDIAIIELSEPVVMTRFISTICLPEHPKSLESVSMNAFVAGWGNRKYLGPLSKILRDAQVPIMNLKTCAKGYQQILDFSQHGNKVICAGSSSGDSCQGDSGGPLMMPQLRGSKRRYYLIGLVSFGYNCSSLGVPSVYTRVSAFLPWIRRNIS